MKPQQLIISAFGSYAGKTEIHFEKQQGIFLITGDTGAGKTTIFDGIIYALYGQTSGGERSGNMMRSQYAPASAKTYVELVFQYRGEIYRIRRNPEYQIEKKLKNGTIKLQKVAAGVELTMPDGTIFPEKRTVTDAKIEEIIGLSAEQFTQIVMIAQGDFLKLLYTKSDERKKIFSKLFRTEQYWRIQERLKNRSMRVDNQIEENKRAYEQEQNRITIPEEIKNILNQSVSEGERALEDVIACIVQIKTEVEIELCSYREEGKRVSVILSGMEDVNHQFEQYERLQRVQIELKSRQEEDGLRLKQIDNAKKAEKIRGFEEKYQAAMQNAEQSVRLMKKLETSILALEDKRKRAGETLEKQQDAYYKMLIEQQAGILAMGLKENEPCPVCGSKEHPALAVADRIVQISQLEKALNKEKEKLAKDTSQLENVQKELQTCRGQLKQEQEKYKGYERLYLQSEEIYKKALEASAFTDEAAYKNAYLPERSRARLERESREYKEKCVLTEGQLEAWEKALKGKQRLDTTQLKEQLRETEAKIKQLERRRLKLHTAEQVNKSVLENSKLELFTAMR